MTNNFRRLLYDISTRLTCEEVDDLKFLFEVPTSAQAKIHNGKDLFKHLEETGVINEQKVYALRKVVKQLTPKRQDLLDYIDRKYPTDDHDEVSSRSISICTTNTINTIHDTSHLPPPGRPPTPKKISSNANGQEPKKYFVVDCFCVQFFGCTITKPFCCCYGTVVFLLFLLLISVVFWFSGKPKTVYTYLNAKEIRKDIGFIVVSVLLFLLVIVIFPFLIHKHGRKIFSWCNQKRQVHMERRRSIRNERQLLRESQGFFQPEPIVAVQAGGSGENNTGAVLTGKKTKQSAAVKNKNDGPSAVQPVAVKNKNDSPSAIQPVAKIALTKLDTEACKKSRNEVQTL